MTKNLNLRNVFKITNYLSNNNIPHNFVLVKAEVFKNSLKKSNPTKAVKYNENSITSRAIIWPKKPSFGKNMNNNFE